jgi:EthD domain
MIKLLYCLRRRPELTLQEFQQHWAGHHSRFGRASRQVLRYVQYHALLDDPIRQALPQAGAGEEHPAPYDGMAAAWFQSPEALAQSMTSPDVAAALEDEKLFIDHSRSSAVLCDEHVIVEPEGEGPIVLVECLARRPDIDRRFFSERWLAHGHIGRKANELGLLQGYIQNHALPEDDARVHELEQLGTAEQGWDGIVTAYFHSVAVAKALFANPLASEESFEDEKQFIDHSKGQYMLARRHVVKDFVR